MTTAGATGIGLAGATLSASYSGASETPREVGFLWGTDKNNLKNELYVNMGSGVSGSFSKDLSGLASSTTYYYKAYILVGTDKYYYGAVKSFTTYDVSAPVNGDADAYAASWLGHYEIPWTDVNLSAGQVSHGTKTETYGGTLAYIYNPSSSTQRIVTHTFSYNNREVSNYTILFDKNKKCALWAAFEMDKTDHPYNDNVGRNESWAVDPAIDADWQMSGSYGNSYTKGHQVASNDRQTTKDENKQTFYYSNMTPQSSALNSGIWNTHEGQVQTMAKNLSDNERLYVVTGPVFESGYSSTSDGYPIPTKYFKCLMKCTFDSTGAMIDAKGAGFIFTHASPSRTDTTIDAVEELAGFDFFRNIPDTLESGAERMTNFVAPTN